MMRQYSFHFTVSLAEKKPIAVYRQSYRLESRCEMERRFDSYPVRSLLRNRAS